MIAQLNIAGIGVGVAIAIPIIGVYVALAKHTGNSNKHAKTEDMVTEKSCTARVETIQTTNQVSDKLAQERHDNFSREMDRLHEETANKFELIVATTRDTKELLQAIINKR